MEAGPAQAEGRLRGVPEPVGFVWIPQGSKLGSHLQTSVEPSSIGCQASGGLSDKNVTFIHHCLSPGPGSQAACTVGA